jgi:hypothetical protein
MNYVGCNADIYEKTNIENIDNCGEYKGQYGTLCVVDYGRHVVDYGVICCCLTGHFNRPDYGANYYVFYEAFFIYTRVDIRFQRL